MNQKYKCKICTGSGLVQATIELCKNCKGDKCYMCRESGYKQYPWIECNNCIGHGSVSEEQAKNLIKSGRFDNFEKINLKSEKLK
jgi:hypothetical protein